MIAAQEFRRAINRHAFRPFTIQLNDGRYFEVTQAEFVAISPSEKTVVVSVSDDGHDVFGLSAISKLCFGEPSDDHNPS